MKKKILIITITLASIFIAFVIYWENYSYKQEQAELVRDSEIISNAFWNLNKEGMRDYLMLALRLKKYGEFKVIEDNDNVFFELKGRTQGSLYEWLIKLHLIQERKSSVPIIYNGKKIGTLFAVIRHDTILLYLNIFIILTGAGIIMSFILLLAEHKHLLEHRIEERTKELVKSKDKVAKSEEYLLAILNSIDDGIIIINSDGIITDINTAAVQFMKTTKAACEGKTLGSVFHLFSTGNDRKEIKIPSNILEEKHMLEAGSFLLISNTGEEYIISNKISVIQNDLETYNKVALVFRDITKETKLEADLRQTQKLETIGQLAGGVAHDFNNMLTGIVGATSILKMKLDDNDKNKKFIDIILDASRRASDLTQNLLMFSRKNEVQKKFMEFTPLVESTIKLLERTIDKSITIETDFRVKESIIYGDATLLQNLILNLGVNARDAIQKNGTITFSLTQVFLDPPTCKALPFDLKPGKYLKLSVRDTGQGIPDNIKDKLFEPFFTTKEVGKGTGLGLSSAYGIVTDHEGAIRVYSELGKGSEFYIYLPLVTSQKNLQSSSGSHRDIVLRQGTVLLIDDEEFVRATGEELLQEFGYDVITASNGEEGLELFKAHSKDIKLIFLDIVMPVMAGAECLKLLREISEDVPIALSSGFTKDASIEKLLEYKNTFFIKKPYTLSQLYDCIEEMTYNENM